VNNIKALVLEDIATMRVRDVPDPTISPQYVVLGVHAVGVCGTDLHLFQGHNNYRIDSQGRPIPLRVQPQILGHEFSGEVLEVGREVKDLRPGDRILCDQGLNCFSFGYRPLCPFCASGDSHQCAHYQEPGITGLPGAMAEYIAMPAVNCLLAPPEIPAMQVAMAEPFACVLHSCDRVDSRPGRYMFEGPERIRNILICGAGPAGLLFLQVLRNIKGFDGQILISDVRDRNLELAREFGGTPINAARQNLTDTVQELTANEGIHYLIEACGRGEVFEQMPALLRKQATVLLYGQGHKGNLGVLSNVLFLEPHFVSAIGASGGFDTNGRSTIYRRSLELITSGKVKVMPLITHKYMSFEEVPRAFEHDFVREDYVKGVLVRD
jgi:L-iditol 2-dehydrogenase